MNHCAFFESFLADLAVNFSILPFVLSDCGTTALFAEEYTVALRKVIRKKSLHLHMQVVFFAKIRDFLHQGGMMMRVNGALTFPTVDQQDGLAVLCRIKILILKIAALVADGGDCTACRHFFGKPPCRTVLTGIIDMDRDAHGIFLRLGVFLFLPELQSYEV